MTGLGCRKGSQGGRTATIREGCKYRDRLDNGATALYISAEHGHPEVMKLLLAKGANTEAVSKTGETAFNIAVKNGHNAIFQFLTSSAGMRIRKVWLVGSLLGIRIRAWRSILRCPQGSVGAKNGTGSQRKRY